MFARRAAAEIAIGDQNPRIATGRPVEDEILALASLFVEAQFAKQMAAEARPRQRLHILSRNDHVGVEIVERQGRRGRLQSDEFLHTSRKEESREGKERVD